MKRETPLVDALVRWFLQLDTRRTWVVWFRADLWTQLCDEAGWYEPWVRGYTVCRIAGVEVRKRRQ